MDILEIMIMVMIRVTEPHSREQVYRNPFRG